MSRPPVPPSPELVAHVSASLAGLFLAAGFAVAALVALVIGNKGAAVAFAILATVAHAARPAASDSLDKETGRLE